MNELQKKLSVLREEIDAVDCEILNLLAKRGESVVQIGELKRLMKSRFHVPERESKIYQRLIKSNRGPYKNDAILSIFREIISASLALEHPLKIAYLGPEGTFTQAATIKRFGSSAETFPQPSISQVFEEVLRDRVDYGVVPIENSLEGVVNYTLDLLIEHALKICGEIKLQVHHNLLSTEKSLKKIKKVYSHPQALAQCRQWLDRYLPKVKTVETPSTARAAEIAKEEPHTAAIASEQAAIRYDLHIISPNIEDHHSNYTRFVVIGNQDCGPTGADKTSLVCSTQDRVGALYSLIEPIAHEKINLTKIESRPLKGRAWEYIFFMDLDGHQAEAKTAKALKAMQRHASYFKILGSYPKGE